MGGNENSTKYHKTKPIYHVLQIYEKLTSKVHQKKHNISVAVIVDEITDISVACVRPTLICLLKSGYITCTQMTH